MKNDHEITALEAARRLNVGLDYLYSLLWTGKLRGSKVNRRWMVSADSVEERAKAIDAKGQDHDENTIR